MGKRITVVQESSTGRNQRFRDNATGETLSRAELVRRIDAEQYPNYHTRTVHGLRTPVSNPDASSRNNLG